MLFLVRHAQTVPVPEQAPEEWELDPAGSAALEALRSARRWSDVPAWYASPEPKAIRTAAALTDAPVTVVEDLRELRRRWSDDYPRTVLAVMREPRRPAAEGWETAQDAVSRFDLAIRKIVAGAAGDVVVVTHGLVLTLWRAFLRRAPVRYDEWHALAFPDLLALTDADMAAWLADSDTPIELYRPTGRRP
jgi:broad specificity phosphatase PhoE